MISDHACACSLAVCLLLIIVLLFFQVRESLTPLLGASLGTAVEASLFELQRGAGAVYKSQWRDIIANLKDPKNDLKSVGRTNSSRKSQRQRGGGQKC